MGYLRGVVACLFLASFCGLAAFTSPAVSAPSLPSGFRDIVVFGGLEEPTVVRFSPDGRAFVAQKEGTVLVYDSLEDPTPTVFADLRTDVYDYGDRGLLGLALDPDFPQKPYVYALYTYDHILGSEESAPRWGEPDHSGDECPQPEAACEVSGRLVRLTAGEGGAGDHAVEDGSGHATQKVLVEGWCQQFSSHSIGDIEFDAEGALYASGGDGASFSGVDYGQVGNPCGDPPGEGGAFRAQDARTPASPEDPTGLNGSVIRVDPASGEGLPGNPMFASLDPNERRIVGYGFRNPFRFTIDPATNELYVGNVGWNSYEEIDRFPTIPGSAYNSGWPCYEGLEPNPSYASLGLSICEGLYGDPGAVTPPFFYYRHANTIIPGDGCHSEEGWVIAGLAFYDGTSFPSAYDGALFFLDPIRGCIYTMFPGSDGRPDPLTTTTFMSEGGAYAGIDVEVGPGGDLYYTKLFDVTRDGTIHRISYDPDAPVARLTASPEWAAGNLQSELDASGSFDPHGEPLGYEWDLDGNGTFETSAGAKITKTFTAKQNVEVAVKVSDGPKSNVAKVTLYPHDTPPEPEIEEPVESLEWRVGQEIDFSGRAKDAEEAGGELDESGLYWKARLYHCPSACHAHPLQVFPAVSGGDFIAPDHDYPAHLEISLTATDSRGLTATKAVSIYPRTVDLTIASNPPGLDLSAGLLSQPAPFGLRVIEGASIVLSAPTSAKFGGVDHPWRGWSDGGARVHSIVADESATYTASYTDPSPPAPGADPEPAPAPPPSTRIVERPRKLTLARTARFVFSSSLPDARFRCSLDHGPFKPCPATRVYKHLKPGKHVLKVFAVNFDSIADGSSVAYGWRVLAKPPRRR